MNSSATSDQEMDRSDRALSELLRMLGDTGYAFVAPSPNTISIVRERWPAAIARSYRDVFGWNLPFPRALMCEAILDVLLEADATRPSGDLLVSRYRVASCEGQLFLHSSFPTIQNDAVFFGPDSYRFAAFIRRELREAKGVARICDIGAGAGVGGITTAVLCKAADVVLTDINPLALRLARINAAGAKQRVTTCLTDAMTGLNEDFDLILANPPYLMDDLTRTYRHGGGALGGQLTAEWCAEALPRLRPGGRMLLYSASAIVDGRDELRSALLALASRHGCSVAYEELDPDVWGEELRRPAYGAVERIALIGATFSQSGGQVH